MFVYDAARAIASRPSISCLLAMQLSGEPTPALRGKDATVDRAASPGTRCGNRCLPVPKRAGQCRGPGSAPDCSLEGASTGTKLGRRSTSTSPPRPFTPRLGRRSPSRRTRRWCACQTAARRLLQAAFNGFLAIKSMRLFALRTVSIGKPARARSLDAVALVGRRWSSGPTLLLPGGLAPR